MIGALVHRRRNDNVRGVMSRANQESLPDC